MHLLDEAQMILNFTQPFLAIYGIAAAIVGFSLMRKAPDQEYWSKAFRILRYGILIVCIHPAVWGISQIMEFFGAS